jgi:uridine phosphorylase
LSNLRSVPPLAPFSPEGEIGTWHDIEIAFYSGLANETSIVPVLEHDTVEYIFALGLAGSLSEDIRPGDLVAPVASVRGDGLTDYWADVKMPAVANVNVLFAIHEAARQLGIRISSGIFYTTTTMYREMDFIKKWAELGVIEIQMEIAQHFILSHIYRKKSAGVYVISDLPLEGDQIWRKGLPMDQKLLNSYEHSVDILLKAIQLLSVS